MRRGIPKRVAPPIDPNRVRSQSLLRPETAEPNLLRDAVCNALSSMSVTERLDFCRRLLGELRTAGLKVRQSLLMLGVSARTSDELTAPEIAALVRYVRLSEPKVMTAVAPALGELVSSFHVAVAGGKAA